MDPRTVFDWYPLTDLVRFGQSDEEPEDIRLTDLAAASVISHRPWVARVLKDRGTPRERVVAVEIDQRVIDEMTTPEGRVYVLYAGVPHELMEAVAAQINRAAERAAGRFITQ